MISEMKSLKTTYDEAQILAQNAHTSLENKRGEFWEIVGDRKKSKLKLPGIRKITDIEISAPLILICLATIFMSIMNPWLMVIAVALMGVLAYGLWSERS